jgi:cellulose synthase/poly-beta-1,6-N-acetylglucosamine synthase-like glycosyltransferase
MNVALMAFNVLRPRGRERLGLSAGIFGNGFALTRATIQAVPYDVHSVVEDLEYHLRLVRSGRRIAFADRTTVRADMPAGGRGVSTQRARWEGGRLGMITQAMPALIKDIAKGNVRLIEPLLDLLLLPLGFHVLLLTALLALPFAATRIYALCAIGLVAFHVAAAVVIGGGSRRDFAALLASPFYVLWKLAAVPGIVRSASRNAEWVRTER